jgi:hypothetical protein
MKDLSRISLAMIMLGGLADGCGPSVTSPDNLGAGDAAPDAYEYACVPTGPENTPATCSDGIDNDCNGNSDCYDPSCSGIGGCPVCGMVQHPLGQPFFLPDGVNSGTPCTTNAQCSGGTPSCVENECHASYTSSLHFDGFGQGQSVTQVSDLVSICVNMEHEWIRDLEVTIQAPSGEVLQLNKFLGRTGGEVYLGHPNDCDSCCPAPATTCAAATPNVGADYCWKPTATNKSMLDYANTGGAMLTYTDASGDHPELPPGDYQAAGAWTSLVGATLNGDWKLVVTDLWAEDVGFVHSWSIAFNPAIVQKCGGPVIQ